MAVIAVVFDFDDTLAPDSTTKLLRTYGIDPEEFYSEAQRLVGQGYDPPLAYLNLLLDRVGEGREFGSLTLASLRDFGASLDGDFFEGIPGIFDDLRAQVGRVSDIAVEFHIISSGLEPVLLGSEVVGQHFRGIHACQLGDGGRGDGVVRHVQRCVTFTEKTRYLYEINKGISPEDSKTKPHLVNQALPLELRPVPFKRMIYVGDGLTDIPCFSLITNNGGTAFGVWDPARMDKARIGFQEFLRAHRVHSLHHPRYREGDELGTMIRMAVDTIVAQIEIERSNATQGGA